MALAIDADHMVAAIVLQDLRLASGESCRTITAKEKPKTIKSMKISMKIVEN